MIKSFLAGLFIALLFFASTSQQSFADYASHTLADSSHTFDVTKDIEWAKPKGLVLKWIYRYIDVLIQMQEQALQKMVLRQLTK